LASEPAAKPAAASDLISFLKALPDCRMRRGIRFPQWWMLLVAILSILSGQGSLVGMERFAKRHRQTLNGASSARISTSRHRIPPFACCWRSWMCLALKAYCGSGWRPNLVCLRSSTPWSAMGRSCGAPLLRATPAQRVSSPK
jgi:hypothetical protein